MTGFKLTAILLLIPFLSVFSQPTRNLKYLSSRQSKILGKTAEKYGDVYSAIDFYEKYIDLKGEDTETLFKLAELYRMSRDYEKAKTAYQKVYSQAADQYPTSLYYLALMQKTTGEYENAKLNFELFKKEYRLDEFKKIIKNDIDGCELGIQLSKNQQNIEFTHLDTTINKAYIEFSPMPLSDNKLLYASLKSDSLIYFSIEDAKKPVRKFYTADLVNDKWVGGKELDGPFNSPEKQTGNGVYSQDGNRFYFTRCETNWQNKITCQIYMSKKENDVWQEPVLLENGINDPAYTNTQPTIGNESKKGLEVIYFVSDRPDGKGGLDIWYAYYDVEKNFFKEPKNAGNKINSEGDEITPYYDQNKHTLYFSSNGLTNIGGFDIFRSNGELGKWSTPENMGMPINSSYDDLYYVPTKNRKEAFMTSNRPGAVVLKNPTCCDDIYALQYLDLYLLKMKGIVFQMHEDKKNITDDFVKNNLSDSAIVSLYLIEGDEEPILISSDTTNSKGEFEFEVDRNKNYRVVATKDGYFNKQTNVTTNNIPKTKELMTVPNLGLLKISKKPFIIDNIYYEFAKATLTEQAKITLDTTIFFIMNETPEIIVEISSHTDSVSSDEFNLKLSQKRAESVVEYLASKGIDKTRMIAKGYGETKPIARNTNPDGTDNPDGRAKNRRTEFKVIGSSNQYSILNREDLNIIKDKEKSQTQ